jgi:hypothetical protein
MIDQLRTMPPPEPPRKTSPFPNGFVARVPSSDPDKISGVLVPRHMGHLIVQLTFHKDPVAGLAVKFFKAKPDGKPGKQLGDEDIVTTAQGIARIDRLVPAGGYVCEIEHQEPTLVTTTMDPQKPFIVPLPVGRPYVDLEEAPEFDDFKGEIEEPAEDQGAAAS